MNLFLHLRAAIQELRIGSRKADEFDLGIYLKSQKEGSVVKGEEGAEDGLLLGFCPFI
jgi:hypothetical protein